jgi:hypothetical protein
MKKTFLFVTVHSLIDTITNSSSEIFICGTDKSVAFVKRYLKDLLKKPYDTDYEEYYTKEEMSYEKVFGKVYTVTEKNVDEVVDYLVLDYGLVVASFAKEGAEVLKSVPELANVPNPPDYFEITKEYRYSYPYVDHEEYNKEIEKQRRMAWETARTKYLNLYGDIIKKAFIGLICIESKEDNSIPHPIWGSICDDLNAFHMHLG